MNYEKARSFILEKLTLELSPNLYYHSVGHTIDVCAAVERLGQLEGIVGDELILLKTAALYHDAGFLIQYLQNESAGAELARTTLVQFGFTDGHIAVISEIIMATQIPQKSKSILEEVMCDADLDYLGRTDFHPIAHGLSRELKDRGIVSSDKQWDEIQIAFLGKHNYFTASAYKLRNEKKHLNLAEVKHRYNNDLY